MHNELLTVYSVINNFNYHSPIQSPRNIRRSPYTYNNDTMILKYISLAGTCRERRENIEIRAA